MEKHIRAYPTPRKVELPPIGKFDTLYKHGTICGVGGTRCNSTPGHTPVLGPKDLRTWLLN